MARFRRLDPWMPFNPKIQRLGTVEQLTFIYCITQADDEGRLCADAANVKAGFFNRNPSVSLDDCAKALVELHRLKHIVRYIYDDVPYIWVRDFASHQKIDRFTFSKLPAPPMRKHRKLKATLRSGLDEDSTSEQRGLDEDSTHGEESSKDKLRGEESNGRPTPSKIVDLFHELCPTLPCVRGLDDKRVAKIRELTRENPNESIWRDVFTRAEASDLLTRRVPSEKYPTWIARFDFFLRPDKFNAVLEGMYDNRGSPRRGKALAHLPIELPWEGQEEDTAEVPEDLKPEFARRVDDV